MKRIGGTGTLGSLNITELAGILNVLDSRRQTVGSPVHSPLVVHFLIREPSRRNPTAHEISILWGYWNSSPFR